MIEFVIFGGMVAIVALGVGGWWWHEKKRREHLGRVAAELSFEFAPRADNVLGLITCRRHLLSLGRSPAATNAMRGSIGDVEAALFEYAYTTGSGKNQSRHRQTVAAFRIPGSSLPAFDLRPENVFHKIGSALGYRDIDLAEHPKFSSRFILRGEDDASIRSLFDEEIVNLMLRMEKASVEACGEWVMLYRAGKRARPESIGALLEDGFTIATALAARAG